MLMPRIISALATLLCIASAPLAAQTVTGKVVRKKRLGALGGRQPDCAVGFQKSG